MIYKKFTFLEKQLLYLEKPLFYNLIQFFSLLRLLAPENLKNAFLEVCDMQVVQIPLECYATVYKQT